MRCLRRVLYAVLVLALLAPAVVRAEFYTWTDERGVKHVSNVPRDCVTTDGTIAPGCQPPKGAISSPPAVEPRAMPATHRTQTDGARTSPASDSPSIITVTAMGVVVYVAYIALSALWPMLRRSSTEIVYVKGPGSFDQEVVGESHYQGALKAICGGYSKGDRSHPVNVRARLVLEDDNEHDDQAVRIDVSGCTVGYLSRDDAMAYRERLEDLDQEHVTIECDAVIVGGWDGGLFDKGHFGVRLDLPVDQV